MELTVTKRTAGKKTEIKKIRREGNIPAIIYSQGKKGAEVVVEGADFKKILNRTQLGLLSTCVFTLHHDRKAVRAIVKDIHYDPVSYAVIHIDFEELHEGVPVKLNIPIQCTGVVDCVGVKTGGGNLRQVLRAVKVSCLPKDIPAFFEVDVRDLNINESKRLRDIQIPNTVRTLVDLNEIAVSVSKR